MPRYSGTPRQRLACSTFVKLMRSSDSVSAAVHAHLTNHNLTISQFGVLEALYHLGPLCQKDLAARILKTAGNITTVITNLEKRALIIRTRNTDDKRFLTVDLTEEGRGLISEIFPDHEQRIIDRMSRLTENEQMILGNLCKKLSSTTSMR